VDNSKLTAKQQALVEEHISYANRLAKRFYSKRRNSQFDLDDFIGAALLGLCDAARRFEAERGQLFKTFSYFRIQGAMYDMLRHQSGMQRRQFGKLVKQEKGEAPNTLPFSFARSAKDLVSLLSVIEEVNYQVHVSIDGETTLSYQNARSPEECADFNLTKKYLAKLLARLPEKQRQVIHLRYFEGKTFEQISRALGGNSKSWISRLHSGALESLQSYAEADSQTAQVRTLEAI